MSTILIRIKFVVAQAGQEVLTWIRPQRYEAKIFCIGFNKTGTTTIGKCLEVLGYRHSSFNRKVWQKYFLAGRLDDIIKYTAKFDSFDDLPWLREDMIPILDRKFPGSKFIYLERDEASWKTSYTRWTQLVVGTEPDANAGWEKYLRHRDFVLNYFKDRPPSDFLILDVRSPIAFRQLAEFVGRQAPQDALPRYNVTDEVDQFRPDRPFPRFQNTCDIPLAKGVRKLTLKDQLPTCAIRINKPAYALEDLVANKRVVDIGCGFGRTRPTVEMAGGTWVGVEPFPGGAHTVTAMAERLPFANGSFDLVIMDAVLEHLQDVDAAFAEVSRILKPGGKFVGYAAYMECFHEISYHHLSFRALEFLAFKHGLSLAVIAGGHRFGIDYHLAVLFYPLPVQLGRAAMAALIRGIIGLKACFAVVGLFVGRRVSWSEAAAKAREYYSLECLRQSVGFTFVIDKPAAALR